MSNAVDQLRPLVRLVVVVGAALTVFMLAARRQSTIPHAVPIGGRLDTVDLSPLVPADRPPPSLADLRGKVVLVNFWGTWCPPCVAEFPHLASLARAHRDRNDFLLLSVSCGGSALPEDAESLRRETAAFLSAGGYDVPTVADVDGRTRQALARHVPVDAFPLTVLVDREGTIVDFWRGYTPRSMEEIRLRTAAVLGN